MLLPHFKGRSDVDLRVVATGSGVTARKVAERVGFSVAASDPAEVLNDPAINAVVIATRHHLHARYVVEALRKGKAVFVEKPLVMNREELGQVAATLSETGGRLQVGFNRRFAPTALSARDFMKDTPNQTIAYRVNAGPLPAAHWLRDLSQGGGRLVGEGCHFIDFAQFLTGARIDRVYARSLGGTAADADDSFAITLGLSDGSVGTILYTALGDTTFPKERVETFGGGRVATIDDYRTGSLTRGGKTVATGGKGQDKGQAAQVAAFIAMATGTGPVPIPADQLLGGAAAMLAALDSLRTGAEVAVEW
jgi:predicted dehydrogenase